jgi:hypothetical protein
MDHNPEIQLAANVIEACDYWAKAAEQTLELHVIARRSHASALDILQGNMKALAKDSQDAVQGAALAANIRVLCAGVAGALLRPASSPAQPPEHRATGAHLVDNEGKLAATILPVLQDRRNAAMAAKQPAAYTEFVIGSAMEFAPVLNTLSKARAMDKPEVAAQTARRLANAGRTAAPGVEVAAAALAACTGGRLKSAMTFADAGLPTYIALESAARVLEQEFARQRQDLATQEHELRASEASARAANNKRKFDQVETGADEAGFKRGLKDVLGIRKEGRQTAEQS